MFSIIMPAYNEEKNIGKAIDSILSQTYKEFELVIVNDGSTDNSQEFIDKYMTMDQRIICYRQENRGLSCARNTGMKCPVRRTAPR